jgi:hypothetical protein
VSPTLVDRLLRGLPQVLPQVEPVSDLDRLRRALTGTLAVATRAVPVDHRDLGTVLQPGRQVRALAPVEQIDRAPGRQIDRVQLF